MILSAPNTAALRALILGLLAAGQCHLLQAQTVRLVHGPAPAAESAYALALQGNLLVLGSPGEQSRTGAVYVHSCVAASCSAATRIVALDLASGDLFGSAVALSANTLAVAAPGQTPSAVYVFVFDGASWVQQTRLSAPDGPASEGFGVALALEGERLLIGADRAQSRSGAAYVYLRSGVNWLQEQRLSSDSPASGDLFGQSVALSADTALIGAPGRDGPLPGSFAVGAAYAFVRELGNWNLQAVLSAAAGASGDSYGYALSLDGDRALIGAPLSAAGLGSVYVHERASGIWSQQAQLTSAAGLVGDRLGWSVALAGDFVVAGAPYARGSCGAATAFRRIGGIWTESPGAGVANPAFGQLIGWSVASDSQRFLLGSPGYSGANDHRGAAYWFDPVEQVLGDGFDTESDTACVDPNA